MKRIYKLSELSDLITTLGVPLAVILWITSQVVALVRKQAPDVVQRYQARRADIDEHSQSIEDQKLKHQLRRDELLALTEAGNRTYTEEQLTQHLSELYEEFNTVNAFVRETVDVRLRTIEQKLDHALRETGNVASMIERLAEVRMFVRANHTYLEALDEKDITSTQMDGMPFGDPGPKTTAKTSDCEDDV